MTTETMLTTLQAMSRDELIEWLLEGCRSNHPRVAEARAAVVAATHPGSYISDEFGLFLGRWLYANREAGRRLLAEADQLEKYGRCRKAGIHAVHEGGKPC